MASSDLKYYGWPSTVNVANFVSVRLCSEGDGRGGDFEDWKEQMVCLLESQDVMGFVDGEILPPEEEGSEQHKAWRRTDRLVKGWILGSIGAYVLASVREKPTSRDVWLELENIFNPENIDQDQHWGHSAANRDFSRYLPLYEAAKRDDWDSARDFCRNDWNLLTEIISSESETALHIAVMGGKSNAFVRHVVDHITCTHMEHRDSVGDTALHNAAAVGNIQAAKFMLSKHPTLLYIINNDGRFPVEQALINGQKETLEYLISKHATEAEPDFNPNPFCSIGTGVRLLNAIIATEYIDTALALVNKYQMLAKMSPEDGSSALVTIAQMEGLFPRTETFSWWQKLIYHCIPVRKSDSTGAVYVAGDIEEYAYTTSEQWIIHPVRQKVQIMIEVVLEIIVPEAKELRSMKAKHQQALELVELLCRLIVSGLPEKEAYALFQTSMIKAAEHGISDIMEIIIRNYPKVTVHKDDKGMNLSLLAARYRLENVVNILYDMNDSKYTVFDSKDRFNNNLMHICGELAPPHRLNLVRGAALQMQRELQWFKEMELIVHPSHRRMQNNDGLTPGQVFSSEHMQLQVDGEEWMKKTAESCNIASALIVTVMFAAAFTVPGGIDSVTGIPLFSGKPAFVVFALADAVSLFTSINSMLMFISILTSRYSVEDFLLVLPKRLAWGLLGLFVSITSMMVAFSAALYLLLREDIHIALFFVLVAVFASLPVTSFIQSQYPILADVVYSTYGPGIFKKRKK